MYRRMSVLAVTAVAAVLALSGCAAPGDQPDVTEPATADEWCTADRVGGSVTHADAVNIRGLDPVGQPGAAASGGTQIQALFDTLTVWDAEAGEYRPHVAESLEPNDDFTKWTMTLREGVKYGNGETLTADDVRANVELHQSPDNAQVSRAVALMISGVEVVDDLTIVFSVDEPYPAFPDIFATDVGMIVNPRIYAERGPEAFALDPSGAGVGPYEVERYTPGDEVVFTAKDDYWGGPVCIDELRFIFVPGAQATLDALSVGELDVAYSRDPFVVATAREEGFESLPTLFNYGEGLLLNSAEGSATADVRVRQAVVAAIDPEVVNARAFEGTALATSALIAPTTGILPEGTEGPEYDPELASELIEEAKADGWDGKVRLYADNGDTRVEEAIAVEALLEAVGFDVELSTSRTVPEHIAIVAADRNFDLAFWGMQFSDAGGWQQMNRLLNSTAPGNYASFNDPRIDEELAALRLATTDDEVREIYTRMQEVFIENPVFASTNAVEEENLHASNVRGLLLTRGGVLRYDKAYLVNE